MLWRTIHLETGEEAGENEKRRVGGLCPTCTKAKPTTRFFLFLFIATSETRYGTPRRACSKLSYSAPYAKAKNFEESLLLPLVATLYPYKLPKYAFDIDLVLQI